VTTPQSSENLNFTLLFDYAVLLGAVFKIVDINSIVSRFTMRDERCLDPHFSPPRYCTKGISTSRRFQAVSLSAKDGRERSVFVC
jgi:hypothetical protein